jgi:hypothetical protein
MAQGRWLATACAMACASFAAEGGTAAHWRSLETPRYAVLSQLGEHETRAWAAEFDQFIDTVTGVTGGRHQALSPLTIVLFAPGGAARGCAVRQGTWGLAVGPARHDALREGVRWLTRNTDGKPRWLETGLAEVFSSFTVHGGTVRWGEAMPDHLAVLRDRGLVPLDRFLDRPDDVVARDGDARRYTAQAWALTHVLFFGGEPARRERFATWLRHRGLKSGDAGFRAAFGAEIDAMQRELADYLEEAPTGSAVTPRGMVEHKYVVSAASPNEVDAVLGRLEVAR